MSRADRAPFDRAAASGLAFCLALALRKQRRAGRQSADGAPRITAPTAFAKEYWILKD